MDWMVVVANDRGEYPYWVEADIKEAAEARAFRLHGSTTNHRANASDRVKESRQVG